MSTNMHEPTTHHWTRTPLSRIPKGGIDGGKVGGVVAGVSKAYGFDLRTTRIATFIAMLILPVLLLVYLAAWVLLPETPAEAQPIGAIVTDRRRMPLMIVIGIVLVAGALGSLGSWFLFDGAPWGLLLIALGVLLWMTATRNDAPPMPPATGGPTPHVTPDGAGDPWATTFPPPTPTTATDEPTTVSTPITDQYAAVSPSPVDTTPGTTTPGTTMPGTTRSIPVVVSAPRRPRRPIGSIGVGIAVLFVAAAAALEALGRWDATALWVIVGALGIVMVALMVSTIVNHSWLLPIPLFLLGLVVLSLVLAQPDLDGESGNSTVRPDTVAAAQERQHLAAGQLTLDLRDVPFEAGEPVVMEAEVGVGQLRVLVPANIDVEVRAEVGAGETTVWGDQVSEGFRQETTRSSDAAVAPAEGELSLDLRVGMGQISVERVASQG
ncbi:MAG: PspC domain-containing protein [Actinobacteria bacterium]|nr:PspC domain-containing protein [Actinomycetota bacterium]